MRHLLLFLGEFAGCWGRITPPPGAGWPKTRQPVGAPEPLRAGDTARTTPTLSWAGAAAAVLGSGRASAGLLSHSRGALPVGGGFCPPARLLAVSPEEALRLAP